jgi:YbgC/YbaW family acyl-CoA thioester hydrolase
MPNDVERSCVSVRVQVAWGDCDPAGIVFYPRFYAWMDQASHILAREMGLRREDQTPPNPDAVGFPLVASQAEYLAPAYMDDLLEVRTWVSRVGHSSLRLRHEIVRLTQDGEQLLVRGAEERVFIGRDARGGMRPRELTAEMRAVLARFADPNAAADAVLAHSPHLPG